MHPVGCCRKLQGSCRFCWILVWISTGTGNVLTNLYPLFMSFSCQLRFHSPHLKKEEISLKWNLFSSSYHVKAVHEILTKACWIKCYLSFSQLPPLLLWRANYLRLEIGICGVGSLVTQNPGRLYASNESLDFLIKTVILESIADDIKAVIPWFAFLHIASHRRMRRKELLA